MSDQTLRLNIDSTGAARGAANFEQSVRRIEVAIQRLEGNSAGAASRISSSFNKINFSGLSSQIAAMSAQMQRANASMMQFNATLNATGTRGFQTFGNGARAATVNMNGLQNSISASYQAGNALRAVFGTLTLASFTSSVFEASNAVAGFNNSLRGVISQLTEVKNAANPAAATAKMLGEQYAFVEDVSTRLGTSLSVNIKEYPKLASAMLLSGRSGEEVARVFEVFSGSMSVMNLSAERSQLVMLALTQMFSKGKISAEELRRQLGEQIPGAFEMMQQAMREATGDELFNLDEALRKGQVTSEAVLLLTEKMAEVYGGQFAAALNTAGAQFRLFGNEVFKFTKTIADAGATQGFVDALKAINAEMRSADFQRFAAELGETLATALRAVGDLFVVVIRNAEALKTVLGAVAIYKTFTFTVSTMAFAVDLFDKSLISAKQAMIAFLFPMTALGAVLSGVTLAIGTIVGVFGLAVASTDEYKNSNLELMDLVVYAWDQISKAVQSVFDYLTSNAGPVLKTVNDLFEGIKTGAMYAMQSALGFLNGVADAVSALFAGENITAAFQKGYKAGSDMIANSAKDFANAAAEFKRVQADQKKLANAGFRGKTLGEGDSGMSSKLDLSGRKFLTGGDKGKGGGGKEEAERRKEFEKFYQMLAPANELEIKRSAILADAARFEDELKKVGITRAQAIEMGNKALLAESGFLSEVNKALYDRGILEARLNEFTRDGSISEERRNQILDEFNQKMLASANVTSEAQQAQVAYDAGVAKVNELLTQNQITADQAAQAILRYRAALDSATLGGATAEPVLQSLRDKMMGIANSFGTQEQKTLAAKQALQEFAMNISDSAMTYEEQIAVLTRLNETGAMSEQTFTNALANARIAHLDLMVQLGEGSYVEAFEANLLRMTESVRNLDATLGDMLGKTTEQLAGGFSDALAGAIVKGEDFGAAMKGIVDGALQSLLSGLINLGIQYLLNSVLASTAQAAVAASTAASMGVIAAAAAPAAAAVNAATFGAGAAAGSAGLTAISALSKALFMAPTGGMKDGGFVSGRGGGRTDSIPTMLSNGEYVVNAASTARNMNLLEAINSGASGAAAAGAAAGAQAPSPNIKIINQVDPSESLSALDTPAGERVIINLIERRKDQISRLIGR